MHKNNFYDACERKIVGTKHFGSTIDITDPCYDRDVWCRMTDFEIAEGTYTCVAWIYPEDGNVAIAGIYLDGQIQNNKKFKLTDAIGVETGLAGFFNNKPDYNDEEWEEFCKMLSEPDENGVLKNAWITKDGFCTTSGYGDGSYYVYVRKNKKKQIDAIEINFY